MDSIVDIRMILAKFRKNISLKCDKWLAFYVETVYNVSMLQIVFLLKAEWGVSLNEVLFKTEKITYVGLER